MQDQYAGDVGDYVKFALLRVLSPGHQLGVAWWLHPDEKHKADGKHTKYLKDPDKWRTLDADLFDVLNDIVCFESRCISALERSGILRDAEFFSDPLPLDVPANFRGEARRMWFQNLCERLATCNVVFVDPDNGIVDAAKFRPGRRRSGKHITTEEVGALSAGGRCVIGYHHNTRREGGHCKETRWWMDKLRDIETVSSVFALRAHRISPRVFFVINAPTEVQIRAESFAKQWPDIVKWFPPISPRA